MNTIITYIYMEITYYKNLYLNDLDNCNFTFNDMLCNTCDTYIYDAHPKCKKCQVCNKPRRKIKCKYCKQNFCSYQCHQSATCIKTDNFKCLSCNLYICDLQFHYDCIVCYKCYFLY